MAAILFEVTDHIATVTINRPSKANSINREAQKGLEDAWREVRQNPDIYVAIVTGAGDRVFCGGADLEEGMDSALMEEVPGGVKTNIMSDLKGFNVWKPIIAAVNGHAIGSGCEMLSGTDIRIAAEHATFGLPEVRIGAIPFGGSVARLVRQIPYCHAMKLLLTGERIGAQEAARIGLVNEVLPGDKVMPRARELAEVIASNLPASVQAIKEVVIRGMNTGLDVAYVLESLYGERIGHRYPEDVKEARLAYGQRRRPQFKGR